MALRVPFGKWSNQGPERALTLHGFLFWSFTPLGSGGVYNHFWGHHKGTFTGAGFSVGLLSQFLRNSQLVTVLHVNTSSLRGLNVCKCLLVLLRKLTLKSLINLLTRLRMYCDTTHPLTQPPTHRSIYPSSFYLSSHPVICPPIHLAIQPSIICLSTHLSTCLSIL